MMASKPRGRPTKRTNELVDEICERVANGTPLRVICREEGKPTWSTVYQWISQDKEFSTRFAQARELGTDAIAEDLMSELYAEPERILSEGGNRIDQGYVSLVKARADIKLKLLAKWNPKRYGDRQILAGDKEAPLEIVHSALDDVIVNLERKLQMQNEED